MRITDVSIYTFGLMQPRCCAFTGSSTEWSTSFAHFIKETGVYFQFWQKPGSSRLHPHSVSHTSQANVRQWKQKLQVNKLIARAYPSKTDAAIATTHLPTKEERLNWNKLIMHGEMKERLFVIRMHRLHPSSNTFALMMCLFCPSRFFLFEHVVHRWEGPL